MKIIKFGAKWCKGCTELDLLNLKNLEEVEKIDVDSDFESVKKYNINKLPTILVFENEIETERLIGKEDIVKRFS